MTRFAALVRTTGSRNELLQAALHSLALQSLPCEAIVIVHGSEEAYAQVRELGEPHTIHAPNADATRKRGFPINVGIEYCLEQLPEAEFLFLLDDDDMVYPFFTRVMADAFAESQADLVYVNTNRREAGKPLQPSFPLKPYYHLLEQNFIPSNGYAVRTAALRRTGVRVDESFEYLEDWHFLLRLLEHGVRFQRLDVTLSEFRTESEVDYAFRNDLAQWRAYDARIREYINRTKFAIPGADLALLAQSEAVKVEPGDRFTDSSMTAALHRRIWELEHSLSWRLTGPLRAVLDLFLRFRKR